MRLIVFSDIHGNIYALEAFLRKIKMEEYDYLVFCGDIFGYYYNQKEVIACLQQVKNIIWLKGNHDEYFCNIYLGQEEDVFKYIKQYGHSYINLRNRFTNEEVDFIASRKPYFEIDSGQSKIGIFHGTPENYLEGRLYPDNTILYPELYQQYNIVLLGHTHCRMERRIGNTLIVNSGSLGQPRDGSGYSYAVVDTDEREVEFCNISFDETELYHQINQYDRELTKLKEVLERRK